MTNANTEYAHMLDTILCMGTEVKTRNSITKRRTGMTVSFWKTPLISVRSTAWRNALREWEWFMSGSSNINDLHEKVKHWWQPWADEDGEIPYNYSKQFRRFDGEPGQEDQIAYLLNSIRNHPFSRRAVATTWNSSEMVCAPITNCHGSYIQFFVEPDNSLHMIMCQRSADMVVGVPHNWIQYWAFLMWLAHNTGRSVGSFQWIGGDCHIYKDHYELANEIVSTNALRKPEAPKLLYVPTSAEFKAEDFYLDAKYEPIIKKSAKMIV